MDLRVVGNASCMTRREVAHAVRWMVTAQLGRRLADNLHIRVRLEAIPQEIDPTTNDLYNVDAYVLLRQDVGELPRRFTIYADPRHTRLELIETLAHECIHIKQIARQSLAWIESKPNTVRWQRRHYDGNLPCNARNETPWEVQAFRGQKRLKNRYLKSCVNAERK